MTADTQCIAADHPALPGHFPGHPVVPGVVILDRVLDAVRAQYPAVQVTGIRKLKFLRPLLPDQDFQIECAAPANGRLRFRCLSDTVVLAEGNLQLAESAA